jgi:hypothetical protein
MSNRNLGLSLFAIFVFVSVLISVFLVFAAHVITTSTGTTSFTLNEDAQYTYNITVNNTDAGQNANITRVNVTFLDTSFVFTSGTNGTSSIGTFSNTTTVLSWLNSTVYLVNGSEWKYFWFNATASTPGIYNITITTVNATSSYTSNLSVTVNDITAPDINLTAPTSYQNLSSSSVSFNCSQTDNYNLKNSTLMGNWSGGWHSNQTTSITGVSNYTNFTKTLLNGHYIYSCYVCDNANNCNFSATNITFAVDTSNSSVSIVSPTNHYNSTSGSLLLNATVTDVTSGVSTVYFNITNSSGDVVFLTATRNGDTSYWNYTLNTSSYRDGAYNVTVHSTDYAGNNNNTMVNSFAIDNNGPVITLISPEEGDLILGTTAADNFTFNVAIPSTVIISSCSLLINNEVQSSTSSISTTSENGIYKSSISTGDYTWKIRCTDAAGVTTNSDSRSFSVGWLSGGGGGGASSTWASTYVLTNDQFASGMTKELGTKGRFKFTIGNADHSIGVMSLTASTATINVSSTPQQATLSIGEEKKFDVTNDNFYDVYVKLNSIANSKANMTIRSLHEQIPVALTPPTGATTGTPESNAPAAAEEKLSSGWIIFIIIVVVILVLLIIFFLASSKKKGKYY